MGGKGLRRACGGNLSPDLSDVPSRLQKDHGHLPLPFPFYSCDGLDLFLYIFRKGISNQQEATLDKRWSYDSRDQ